MNMIVDIYENQFLCLAVSILMSFQAFAVRTSRAASLSPADVELFQRVGNRLSSRPMWPSCSDDELHDVEQRIWKRPELAITPFSSPDIAACIVLGEKSTLFRKALWGRKVPFLLFMLDCGVSPLQKLNVTWAPPGDTHFDLLVRLARMPDVIRDIDVLTEVIEWAEKNNLSSPNVQFFGGALASHFPRDLERLVADFTDGVERRNVVARQILRALKELNDNGETVLDRAVVGAVMPSWIEHSRLLKRERARHHLCTYLLSKGVPLCAQNNLHSERLRGVTPGAFFENVKGSLGLSALVSLAYWCFKAGSEATIGDGVGFFVKSLPFTLATATYFWHRNFYEPAINIWKERYLAWKHGITDIWGRKKEH